MLSDDVKKNQKIASETARAASAFNRVGVGKESEAARKSLANGLGKFGKLLICS